MRLSRRLPDSLEENDLSRAVSARRSLGQPFIDLTVSNPTACGLGLPESLLQKALQDPALWRYAPDPMGLRTTREAVAAYHGHGTQADQILLAASTSEGYAWLFKLLGDPGAEVLVPTPSYPLFTWLARLEGMEAVPVPAFWHERWHLDLEALEAAITPRTVSVVVVNPNNPTGQYLTHDEWRGLTALCARRDLTLIVDEVFLDYSLEPPSDALGTVLRDPNPPCPVFILSGISKIAALPQVKLGWIMAHGAQAGAMLPSLAFLADQYLSVSAAAQALGTTVLEARGQVQGPLRERLSRNLGVLDEALSLHPHLGRLTVEGGWSVLLRIPALESAEACCVRLVSDHGVLVHPGPAFDLPGEGHLVLSLLLETSVFQSGLGALLGGLALPSRVYHAIGLPTSS